MSRWCVYVNTTKKHIRIHPESYKPCKEVYKQSRDSSAYPTKFKIERLPTGSIKTSPIYKKNKKGGKNKKSNFYWILVWSDSSRDIRYHFDIVQALSQHSISESCLRICEKCQ